MFLYIQHGNAIVRQGVNSIIAITKCIWLPPSSFSSIRHSVERYYTIQTNDTDRYPKLSIGWYGTATAIYAKKGEILEIVNCKRR